MKRKLLYLIPFIFTFFVFVAFGIVGDPNADKSPNITTVANPDTTTPGNFTYPELFNFNYSTVGGMNGGTVGAMFFGGKYYFNCWNSTRVYRYNNNGPGGGPGTVYDSLTYVGACRDLATDGVFIYGGNAATSIYRFDPNTMATLKTFTLTGGQTRAIAWDPNRKGFWNTAFAGNIFCHDTNGVLIKTITSTLAGKYGLCFDSTTSADTAYLWAWDQTSTTTNGLYKYNVTTGALVASWLFTLPGTSIGTAGGADIIANAVPGKLVLLLNYQNFAMVGYNLKNLTTPSSWTEQTSGITTALYSVSAVDDNVAWACGSAGKVLRTTNKGVNWVNVSGDLPTSSLCYNIYAYDANLALLASDPAAGAYVYKTTNGGTNWTQTFFLAGAFGDGLFMRSATEAYFYGDPVSGNWLLKKSTDGGSTWADWATVPTTATGGWNNGHCVFGNNIWIGTNTANLLYTSNNGTNWSTQTTTLANEYLIWFNSATNGLVAEANLNKTTNTGLNWTAITNPGTTNAGGLVGAGTEYWYCNQAQIVYYTSNEGANWASQYTAPTTGGVFYHMTRSRSGNTIWGVRSLGGISRYGSPISGITPIVTNTPSNYRLEQNYPNPFNPATKITFALPKSGLVTLRVYDISGREITTLLNSSLNVGTYSYEFNGANLSSGVYFYKLEANGFSAVKKMMLIK